MICRIAEYFIIMCLQCTNDLSKCRLRQASVQQRTEVTSVMKLRDKSDCKQTFILFPSSLPLTHIFSPDHRANVTFGSYAAFHGTVVFKHLKSTFEKCWVLCSDARRNKNNDINPTCFLSA